MCPSPFSGPLGPLLVPFSRSRSHVQKAAGGGRDTKEGRCTARFRSLSAAGAFSSPQRTAALLAPRHWQSIGRRPATAQQLEAAAKELGGRGGVFVDRPAASYYTPQQLEAISQSWAARGGVFVDRPAELLHAAAARGHKPELGCTRRPHRSRRFELGREGRVRLERFRHRRRGHARIAAAPGWAGSGGALRTPRPHPAPTRLARQLRHPARALPPLAPRPGRRGGRAAISIGTNPHYAGLGAASSASARFEGDLCGQRLVVELWQKRRDERAFENEADLVEQIACDVEQTRQARRQSRSRRRRRSVESAAAPNFDTRLTPPK